MPLEECLELEWLTLRDDWMIVPGGDEGVIQKGGRSGRKH